MSWKNAYRVRDEHDAEMLALGTARPFDTDRIDNPGVYRPAPVVAVPRMTPFRVWFGTLIFAAMLIGALLAFAP